MRQKSVPEKEPATQVVKNIRRVRRTLEKIGIPRATFYRWYDLYRQGGLLDEPDDFKLFGGGVPHRGDTSRRKTRSALYWKGCAARTLSPSSPEPLLSLVERLSRGGEEATGWRYGPGRDLGRGQGPAPRSQRAPSASGRKIRTRGTSPSTWGPRYRKGSEWRPSMTA
jgi:transposase-like protein